ncbi:MAG: phosphodiester glycosidase family protein [Ignavibacteriales bacterium]|nr:phosphodiester glycosidase family protein [Ignavibacteriales bacterium]
MQNGVSNQDNVDRHPRTSAGFNQDTTVLFMFVVMEDVGFGVGMTYKELADYMKLLGVYQGLNLMVVFFNNGC